MKLALIGNSHIACIREAWAEKKFDLDITFFGSHKETLNNTVNRKNTVCPTDEIVERNFKMTSNGESGIDLASYDALIIHGLLPRPTAYEVILKNKESEVYYSLEVKKKTSPLYNSIAHHLITNIRTTSAIPIIASHTPFPASLKKMKLLDEEYYNQLKRLLVQEASLYDVKILFQHPDTITDLIYTKSKFTKGSRRLDVENVVSIKIHPEDDVTHMNKEFGMLYLENLCKIL